MLPIKDPHDKKTFSLIISYIKAGGKVNLPFMLKFCKKYEIDAEAMAGYMADNAEEWVGKLKQAGLI